MEVDDDNGCNGTQKTKKKPLDLGWNRLLPTTSSGDDDVELERRNKPNLEKETCEAEVKQETCESEDGNPVQKRKRGRSPILQAKRPNGLQQDRQRMLDPPAEPQSFNVEVIRESQEQEEGDNGDGSSQQKKKRRHRKKGADEPRLKTKSIAWTNDEQMSLAKAWLEVTEDPMCANYQRERTYWKKIISVFLGLIGKRAGYRDNDGVCSKWRKMRISIQAFNQIFTRMNNANQHPSGVNDATIQQRALQEYQAMRKPAFRYLAEWEYLRHSSKFAQVVDFDPKSTRSEPSAERLKTTSSADIQSQGSDAHCNIHLNTTVEEGERYVYQCSIGRDTAKKVTYAGSSGRAKYTETFEKIIDKLEGLIDISKKRVELEERKLKLEETKQKLADLKILCADYSDLSGAAKELAEQIKQEIREKYVLM